MFVFGGHFSALFFLVCDDCILKSTTAWLLKLSVLYIHSFMHVHNTFKLKIFLTMFYFQLKCITPCMRTLWHQVIFIYILYVCQMCCKLKLKTLNNRKTTASLRNQRKRRVCSDPCICSTQRYSFFFQRCFAPNLKNISPIVWYCCNIWCPYKIANILYKTNEKAVFFIDNIWMVTWPFLSAFIFPAAWRIFVRKHLKRCVVVSFSSLT